jgi:acyl dehydratase
VTEVALDELPGAVGHTLGPSAWHCVGEEEVARFTRAVGGADGAATEVPPLMVLSLTNRFLPEVLDVVGASSGVNYGTGAVRFPEPVPVGSRLRASAEIVDVTEVAGGLQATVRVVHEVEGRQPPACVVDTISRYLR